MIQQDKLKTMTQLALYEKKRGKQDFSIYTYRKKDFIRFQGLKTMIAATAAFLIIGGFVVLWNLEVIISHFDAYDYKHMVLVILIAYAVFLIFFVKITSNQSRELYNEVRPRVRQYYRNLRKMEAFYEEEDKVREEFEKGEWRDGK